MVEKKSDGEVRLRRPVPEGENAVSMVEGVMIVITQAFCPNGHNLVRGGTDALFDGYPGICLFVEHDEWSAEVTLSPIHGDHSKIGMTRTVEVGTRCVLKCPECEVELPKIAGCGCEHDGDLVGLYLRADLSEGDVVGICNVLGCYRSRVMDKFELLSEFVENEEHDPAG